MICTLPSAMLFFQLPVYRSASCYITTAFPQRGVIHTVRQRKRLHCVSSVTPVTAGSPMLVHKDFFLRELNVFFSQSGGIFSSHERESSYSRRDSAATGNRNRRSQQSMKQSNTILKDIYAMD